MTTIEGTMIDTETLSVGDRAMIWEVACVPFTMELATEGLTCRTGNPLHALVNYDDADTDGLDVNFKTIAWTNKTRGNDPAWQYWKQRNLMQDGAVVLPEGLSELSIREIHEGMKNMVGVNPIWFRNSAFDVPRLDRMFAAIGDKTPWHRRQQSDLYSLINVAKQTIGYEDVAPASTEHHAAGDAISQIGQLANLLKRLNLVPAMPVATTGMGF